MLRRISALIALSVLPASLVVASGAEAATPQLTRVVEYLSPPAAVNEQGSVDQAMSSPTFGDVTGDGVLDLVVGTLSGQLLVLDPLTGSVLRDITVQTEAMIQGAPTLVDVTGDGVLDVAVGTVRNVQYASHVKIYDLTTNTLVFDRTDAAPDHPPRIGFFASPAVGDIDGDGRHEVVAINADHRLYAWNLDGSTANGFPVRTYDTSLSSPALADVDGDGALDIVVGSDMDDHPESPAAPGGYLWVVDGRTGFQSGGFGVRLGSEVLWSSPAIGDVDGDGDLDAVIGTGRNFFTGDSNKLYAVDLRTGGALPGWPRTLAGNTMPSPALVQLDGDRQLEVIATTGNGVVHRLDHDGATTWTACAAAEWQGCGSDYAYLGSPVVADVDSDPLPEVVVVGNRELLVFDAATGALEHRETIRSNSNSDFAWVGANAPAVATDGVRTMIGAYVQIETGDLVRRHGDRQGIYVWTAGGTPATLPWPQFQSERAHLGVAELRAFPGLAPGSDLPLGATANIGWFSNIETALAISKATWPDDGASHAVIARDDTFADALAGTVLLSDGPMLLTKTGKLHPNVLLELGRVLAPGATVYLLGGTEALSPSVESALGAAGYTTVRRSGTNRIGTAVAISQTAADLAGGIDTVYLARAFGPPGQTNGTAAWADSAAVGGATASSGSRSVVLLTQTGRLDSSVSAEIDALGPDRVVLLGGPAALSESVESEVEATVGGSAVVERIAGANRAVTAAEFARDLGVTDRFVLANAFVRDGWAAALPGAALAASHGAAMLWTPSTGPFPGATDDLVRRCTGTSKSVRTIGVGGPEQLGAARLLAVEALDHGAGC